MTKRTGLVALTLLSLLAASSHVAADEFAERTAASKQVTGDFIKQLGGALQRELKANGPVEAIKVCKDIAPSIANELSLKNGWQVTRVSHKPRNSMIGMADSWEQNVLQQFEQRAAKGENYKDMFHAEVVAEPNGKVYRFMKAIPTAEKCLLCHGSEASIPPPVLSRLQEVYPHDRARGFSKGELRGAVSIRQPMN